MLVFLGLQWTKLELSGHLLDPQTYQTHQTHQTHHDQGHLGYQTHQGHQPHQGCFKGCLHTV